MQINENRFESQHWITEELQYYRILTQILLSPLIVS